MRVEQVDFITVPTRDVRKAKACYTEILGLPASEQSDAEVETPNVTVSFWNPESQGEQFFANQAAFALRVEDVQGAVEEVLPSAGEIVGTVDTGVCHTGFVEDPDGNTVILHRRYAPRG
jgi:catechol 2,3-dioxygenase-like lactoylglutathione lyase family enzyme